MSAFCPSSAAAQDFSGYQSDGMLLEAGFISLFFAPAGFRPGFGRTHPVSRASLFLLQWEWFRIYFESGVVKILSGDPEWRNFTAMDEYYQNGPLPTWIGWYVAAPAAWVSCGDGLCHAGSGVGAGLDAISAAALADFVLLHGDAVADRRDPDGKLHLSELSRSWRWVCSCSMIASCWASCEPSGECAGQLRYPVRKNL